MNVDAAQDPADCTTPAPEPADGPGRSDQTFMVDVRVRAGGLERGVTAHSRDI